MKIAIGNHRTLLFGFYRSFRALPAAIRICCVLPKSTQSQKDTFLHAKGFFLITDMYI